MSKIKKTTKTKLKSGTSTVAETSGLEPGEIRAITKSVFIGNVSEGTGSGTVTPVTPAKAASVVGQDLNEIKDEGDYYAGGGNKNANKPEGIDAFGLTVKRTADGYYSQYLTGGNSKTGIVYVRTFGGNKWSPWMQQANVEDLTIKQDRLVAGENITLSGSTISARTMHSHNLNMYFASEDQKQMLKAYAIIPSNAEKSISKISDVFDALKVTYLPVSGIYVDGVNSKKYNAMSIFRNGDGDIVIIVSDMGNDMTAASIEVNTSVFKVFSVNDSVI